MQIQKDKVISLNETKVCWMGQEGGFEGVRQKGWSILNFLALRREALSRNTRVLFLAQGDNQNIVTLYSLTNKGSTETIKQELLNIWYNNDYIMKRIQIATSKLGLLINDNEVVTSAELMIYGKVPIFRGKETKRWSRISTTNNDQIPSFASAIAGSITTSLSVNQYSDHPLEIRSVPFLYIICC